MEKLQKEIKLSDGRKIVLQETTGLDEMIAAKIATKGANAAVADLTTYLHVIATLSIVSVDGKKVKRPTSLPEVQAVMAKLKTKDTSLLMQAYQELNADTEDQDTGEDQATD